MTDAYSTHDLRSFLEYLDGKPASQFQRIEKSISPEWVTTAVVTGLAKKLRSPVIRFDHVEGSDYPMVTNVCASLDRVAKSVGLTSDALNQRFVDAKTANIPPITLSNSDAPVSAHTRNAGEFSLQELPQLKYSDTQSTPYITSAIVVGRDPDSGAHNLSFHRLMMIDDTSAAIYMTPNGHLDQIWKKHSAKGQLTPLAAVIGTHPLWCYAALIAGALEDEDYDMVSGVLDAPLALTPTTVDANLLVPALAEMVLEGFIEPAKTASEGPFGEFLGYVADVADRPVVRFETLRHRDQPVYQDIVAGQIEHLTMSSISLRARLHRDYFRDNPAVIEFFLPAPMTIFLKIDQSQQPDFDAVGMMDTLLCNESYLKQAYCFDPDIDLRKQASVQTAIACFAQPIVDVTLYRDKDGNGVDPSETNGRTSKIAVDARSKVAAVRSELPGSVTDDFDLNDWIR
ncbi:MAG: UbiD family decarboxylase domain-containing protein [Pseudomonadota bacterium]